MAGECQYRDDRRRRYEWLIEAKENAIKARQKRQKEAEQKERERLARLEKERIERLLGDAAALRQASDIRSYVEAVRALCTIDADSLSPSALEEWTEWALAQAARIDPVQSGRFIETMKDPDDSDGDD